MGIKLVDDKDLSDSEIEKYQHVEGIESQDNPELSETSGQHNFSGFVLLWSLNLDQNKIDLEIKGRQTGKSYGKELLDKSNNVAHFSFRSGTSESMTFFYIQVSADFDRKELKFDGYERTRGRGRMLPRREYESVVLITW
jgi:hypothetical protein